MCHRRIAALGLVLLTSGFLAPCWGVALAAEPAPPALKLPPGFVIEKVAGPPLVEHPIMAGFDERGRLFVAESAGLNMNAAQLLKDVPNSIRLLEDTDGDGRFDKASTFADKMAFPMGALWHDGALYVCAAPSVWKLEDTKGTGVADKRTELVTKFGFTGNAADIHGPFPGPDGRLYWTDGRHGHEIQKPDGSFLRGKAARIFRCKPDGSDIEVICGGGMDDPVEIAFTSEGEALATVDILISKPNRIDALIYCIEGGVYPHSEAVIKEFKRTGDLLPAVANIGWVAPSGLMRYRSLAFGAEYKDNLFLAEFNTHKVQRHILERDGATFRTRNEDFLLSSDPDSHFTDVLEDADGSLLVIDTGGWFRNGCPTSRIAKPEIHGGIYRIRRADAPRPADPRGLNIKWDQLKPAELVKLLDDARWVVRDRAVHQLGKQGDAALVPLRQVLSSGAVAAVTARRNAVWALTRIEGREARALLRPALGDKDISVRLAAAHAVGLHRDADALSRLTDMVRQDTPAARRQAAAALGRIRNPAAVPALLDGLRTGGDRFLEHSLIYALLEIADRDAIAKGLSDPSPLVRRAALIALDQMNGGNVTREEVTPLLNTDHAGLQQAALAIVIARPEWARDIVGLLRQWLTQDTLDVARQESLRSALLAFHNDPAIQELIAQSLKDEQAPVGNRMLLLETIARMPFDRKTATNRPAWIGELGHGLRHKDAKVVRQTVATLRATGLSEFDTALVELAKESAKDADLRVAALGAIAARRSPGAAPLEPGLFDFLVSRLDKNAPPLSRLAAAEVVSNARLNSAQLESLAGVVAGAGALEMPHLLAAFEQARVVEVGQKLVAALDKAPGLPGLSPESLRRTLKDYPEEVRRAAEPLVKRISIDTEMMKTRLAELKPALGGGEARRGRDVFFGKKAACMACHLVKGDGGHAGPDLSKIGTIRTADDLLEAIVFPSASFVRGYEPMVVETRDGRVLTGIIVRETPDSVFVHTADRAEIRIARASVESLERGRISIMPQGLEAQITRQELADLISFLLSLK